MILLAESHCKLLQFCSSSLLPCEEPASCSELLESDLVMDFVMDIVAIGLIVFALQCAAALMCSLCINFVPLGAYAVQSHTHTHTRATTRALHHSPFDLSHGSGRALERSVPQLSKG